MTLFQKYQEKTKRKNNVSKNTNNNKNKTPQLRNRFRTSGASLRWPAGRFGIFVLKVERSNVKNEHNVINLHLISKIYNKRGARRREKMINKNTTGKKFKKWEMHAPWINLIFSSAINRHEIALGNAAFTNWTRGLLTSVHLKPPVDARPAEVSQHEKWEIKYQ